MATLHTINQSPSKSTSWHKMLRLISTGDSILLIEDACYACMDSRTIQELDSLIERHSITVYVLETDHMARGLPKAMPWRKIGYDTFVALASETDKTVAWCAE